MTNPKSTVHYLEFAQQPGSYTAKMEEFLTALGSEITFPSDALVALKVHFGERGNTAFLPPMYAATVARWVRGRKGLPFLTDSTPVYVGSRSNAVIHIETALQHGFNYTSTQAPVIIADGIRGMNGESVAINQKHYAEVQIAQEICRADYVLMITHFKGHCECGFGGTIKNLAMGCTVKATKLQMHSTVRPQFREGCIMCGHCLQFCPTGALHLGEKSAVIDDSLCIGCGQCLAYCPQGIIQIRWNADSVVFQEKVAEVAYAAAQRKQRQIYYLSFLINVVPECDCFPYASGNLVPDLGILASTDPVALDQASVDLVMQAAGRDPFQLEGKPNWQVQLNYAEQIGLGSRQYELVPFKKA